MRMYDIILKKREGMELSKSEIDYVIKGYTSGEIPDYQVSSFLMAIYFQKMNKRETADLTMAIVNSGEVLSLNAIEGIKVDKHSTGGVGDKTTLVLGPMVAAAGAPVAKMSGRGLGHTGGTIDKLESIKGFSTSMDREDFIKNVNIVKLAVVGQTADLAPADKMLYALRDVTGTVDNISLIASSIMSKKIASGADGIVLDVKTGTGAFMKTTNDSFLLAQEMVDIGTNVGRQTVAVISDMDEPLGMAIGNSLEVKEAIDTLKGVGPKDLMELCLTLGAQMLVLAKKAKDADDARVILTETISSGKAFEKFKEFVNAQGGDISMIENTDLLPAAKYKIEVKARNNGYISKIIADEIGIAALILGAGRETKDSKIDYGVGVILNKKVSDRLNKDDVIATIHANNLENIREAEEKIHGAFHITDNKPENRPLIFGVVTEKNILKY